MYIQDLLTRIPLEFICQRSYGQAPRAMVSAQKTSDGICVADYGLDIYRIARNPVEKYYFKIGKR